MVDDLIRFGFGRRTAYTARYIGMDLMGLDLAYDLMKAKGQEPWGPIKERVEGCRKLFHLPDDVIPLSVIPIGHPAESKPPVDRFDRARIHRNTW